jgi:hypothetical protein
MTELVLPTVEESKAERLSRRRAYLACIVTFHLKDHLAKVGETGIENAMRADSQDNFDVVRGICNGTKHVRTDGSHPIPFAAGDDWERPPAVAGRLMAGVSVLGDAVGGREITDGSERIDIYSAVKAVLQSYCKLYPRHLGASDLTKL